MSTTWNKFCIILLSAFVVCEWLQRLHMIAFWYVHHFHIYVYVCSYIYTVLMYVLYVYMCPCLCVYVCTCTCMYVILKCVYYVCNFMPLTFQHRWIGEKRRLHRGPAPLPWHTSCSSSRAAISEKEVLCK